MPTENEDVVAEDDFIAAEVRAAAALAETETELDKE